MGMHIQNYTCEDGAIAKFIIPEDATEEDLKGIKELLNVIMSRKFKMSNVSGDKKQSKRRV